VIELDKFIPYEKLSKKKKRELASQRRGTWAMDPVTRRGKNPKAYVRRKARIRDLEDPLSVLFSCSLSVWLSCLDGILFG